MFHRKVERVDTIGKSLKAYGEEVKGWMAAITMKYGVDDRSVLRKGKPGDHLKATVYDGDPVIHKVAVLSKKRAESTSKK